MTKKKEPDINKTCITCDKEFMTTLSLTKYCSAKCRTDFRFNQQNAKKDKTKIERIKSTLEGISSIEIIDGKMNAVLVVGIVDAAKRIANGEL